MQSTVRTGVSLFSSIPIPKQAFLLALDKNQNALVTDEKNPSTAKTFFNRLFEVSSRSNKNAELTLNSQVLTKKIG